MIYLASDHRGMVRKEEIKKYLTESGEEYKDAGNLEYDPGDDEVDFAKAAAEKMGTDDRGIFFCGSGVMVDVVANRYPRLRSCLGWDEKQVRMARNDDDVNVLSVAADFIDLEGTQKLVKAFLTTPFSKEERFKRRIKKVSE